MSALQWLRARLRRPTLPEIALGALVVAVALHRAPAPTQRGPQAVRVDTVTVREIAKQEPPVKPGLLHRAAYRDVQPERVQVAPGAGRELLVAVCDTARAATTAGPDSTAALPKPTVPAPEGVDRPAAPALAYAGTISQPWTPWGKVRLRLFAVSREGESITDAKVHLPAEWRTSPEPVIREARGWRRVLKPVPFVAGVFAAGWVAHSVASQF